MRADDAAEENDQTEARYNRKYDSGKDGEFAVGVNINKAQAAQHQKAEPIENHADAHQPHENARLRGAFI